MSYKVRIVGDTQSPHVKTARITSFEIYAPRFLLAEINTHRILAKSAQSSRAVPVKTRIQNMLDDPYVPDFARNQRGMQAGEMLDPVANSRARNEWLRIMRYSADSAHRMADDEVHKQWANRVIEPYVHFYGIITGTEWENFWKLRTHESAQPEFQTLARMMLHHYAYSKPDIHDYHLPYIEPELRGQRSYYDLMNVSAARCARVSYKNHDGTDFSYAKDLSLCEDLIEGGHLSPFDHPAVADQILDDGAGTVYWANPQDHRHLWGWASYRVDIERMKGWTLRRDSYAPIPQELLAA